MTVSLLLGFKVFFSDKCDSKSFVLRFGNIFQTHVESSISDSFES